MPTILRLYPYKLVSLDENSLESVLNQLKKIFHLLDIMKSSSHLVAISKTLHFLLPKLVVPIDRTYTLQFFYGTNKYYKERKREWELFKEIFIKSSEIAKSVQYKNNVDATIPKLIDDAIIGFVKQENSPTKMGQSDP